MFAIYYALATATILSTFASYLNSTFDLLGDCIIAAHAKDVSIDTRHWVLKLDEVPVGTGYLDYETFLRRIDGLDNEIILTIEHFRDVAVSGATMSPNFAYLDTELENARGGYRQL